MTDNKSNEVGQVKTDGAQQLAGTVGRQGVDNEASAVKRLSARQRRASLDEYREEFLTIPKTTDRQTVFVSRATRDKIDRIVRLLGERKMSVSGFLENLARHHLDLYAEELEHWRKM